MGYRSQLMLAGTGTILCGRHRLSDIDCGATHAFLGAVCSDEIAAIDPWLKINAPGEGKNNWSKFWADVLIMPGDVKGAMAMLEREHGSIKSDIARQAKALKACKAAHAEESQVVVAAEDKTNHNDKVDTASLMSVCTMYKEPSGQRLID